MHIAQIRDRALMAASDAPARNRSASLRRGLALLMAIGASQASPDGVTLTELASTSEIDKSTTLRLLAPLRDVGLVDVDAAGRYRLGVAALHLGQCYLERLDLRAVALPVLQQLSRDTEETAHLVVYRHPDVVYVDKVESDAAVQMRSRIGQVQPAASTSVGKAYLAFADAAAVDAVIAAGLRKRTASTITSARRFRAELAATRARGYAIDDCENEAEIRCVGAAILDHRAQPVAALSVAGPASRLDIDRAHALGPAVARAAQQVSARLGAITGSVPA